MIGQTIKRSPVMSQVAESAAQPSRMSSPSASDVSNVSANASSNAVSKGHSGIAPGIAPVSLPWIERLVAFDTVSRNPNLGLIETVRDALRKEGIDATLTHGDGGAWANLFATIPAHDGETNGGVVLSGHTDVVPVDGQKWDSDPFRPEVRDGLLYGRGSCDMKGFIGAALTLVPEMQNTKLARPIHLALSF